ncbi:cytochrome c oxidase subunit 3 [Aliikangiella coralliicola]|uniref:cytochrome-c oxidase n=1 Tax=Aliikangiella coralliicola TaxID=2592383 RepID=A0A545UH56_9GAMM|nr:cytochrome c oxidase subunit 3 [Aliikangiella coralliicola]TQV88804.1 cytochrome c oxidase subunit 3 [Aliikangiella coralliicola]
MSTETEEKYEKYYVPEQSKWPIVGAVGLFLIAFGGANFIQQTTGKYGNDGSMGWITFAAGLTIIFYMMWGWWRDTINESMEGLYSSQMDRSFRQGMLWFISSEVMFFAAFFGALFYARALVMPWLGGEGNNVMTHALLWPDFIPQWPMTETPGGETTQGMGPWGLPAINTAILLTSSWTLTIAHHALRDGNRNALLNYTSITALLGIIFLGLQVWEYIHAYQEMGLTLGSGIYGSTFFMLTGFHGFHVTIGTIYLIVLSIRCASGHFTAENHFAYEAGAWYWHFVDVVWLFLFIFVYII